MLGPVSDRARVVVRAAVSGGGGRVVEVESVAMRGCARPAVLDFRPTAGFIVGADMPPGRMCPPVDRQSPAVHCGVVVRVVVVE